MDFYYKKSTQSKKLISNQNGVILLLLMPFLSLILTGFLGLSIMSLGIKKRHFHPKSLHPRKSINAKTTKVHLNKLAGFKL